MGKTSAETLIDGIAEVFNTYLDKGVRLDPVVKDIDPDLNIDDLEMLLRVHFVLTGGENRDSEAPGVIDFVEQLQDRLRRIKTTVTKETNIHRGEIRGRIDWQQTIKERCRGNYADSTRFACQQSRENYNIEENIILKQLLATIHEIVFDDLAYALDREDEYRWLGDWIDSQSELHTVLDTVFRENIYLQRIGSDDVRITDRMIESVKKSRISLYEEAAHLLDRYRRLMEYDVAPEEAKELLANAFIAPEKTETLFELYWIFQLLQAYDDVQFKLLDGSESSNLVAKWTTDASIYRLYHDSTGSLTYSERLTDVEQPNDDGYLYRSIAVVNEWQRLSDELLDRGSTDGLWGGRPDIVLERDSRETGEIEDVFVGEVKYTRDADYAAQGLRELLEYMAYVKDARGEEYVEKQDDLLDSERVHGLLFVDKLSEKQASEEDISILELDDELAPIL